MDQLKNSLAAAVKAADIGSVKHATEIAFKALKSMGNADLMAIGNGGAAPSADAKVLSFLFKRAGSRNAWISPSMLKDLAWLVLFNNTALIKAVTDGQISASKARVAGGNAVRRYRGDHSANTNLAGRLKVSAIKLTDADAAYTKRKSAEVNTTKALPYPKATPKPKPKRKAPKPAAKATEATAPTAPCAGHYTAVKAA